MQLLPKRPRTRSMSLKARHTIGVHAGAAKTSRTVTVLTKALDSNQLPLLRKKQRPFISAAASEPPINHFVMARITHLGNH